MRTTILSLVLFVTFGFITQAYSEDKTVQASKFDQFLSKKGQIIRFEDSKLDSIKTDYSVVDCRIRKVYSGPEIKYFFQLSMETKYGTKTASIEYLDLLDTLSAIDTLISYADKDKSSTIDYIENKFIADDFEIGYFTNNGISWYMDLSKFSSDGNAFFSDISVVKAVFVSAKNKIELLK